MALSLKVGLVNYDSGNIRSVCKALEHEGALVSMVSEPDDFAGIEALVLPGVGAFGDAASTLQRRRLWQPVGEWLQSGRPFLGICLGYQLLFESSEESPGVPGLGILQGKVLKFTPKCGGKIPHMGWNTIQKGPAAKLVWHGLSTDSSTTTPDTRQQSPSFYFVHSYYPAPKEENLVSAWCDYGGERFAAAVEFGRAVATQFHPEKSQANGLRVIRNFLQGAAS